jgi:SAM-dependent methyltransferase
MLSRRSERPHRKRRPLNHRELEPERQSRGAHREDDEKSGAEELGKSIAADRKPWQSAPVPKIYFDEHRAERYDADSTDMFEPAVVGPAVSFLADLAGTGAALELGIGTGRIALPLSRRGVRLHGIDLSPAMVAQLQAKPGTENIGVTIGDFASTKVDRTFTLAYLVYNTIMNLTTQEEQVQCFRNVAAHLEPGGCFVIEVGVPGLQRLPPGETIQPFLVSPTRVGFDEYDVAVQGLVSHHYWLVDGRSEYFSMPFRYVWPSELDLMARIAGLTLRERWNDWHRAPFTSNSTTHVSVWEKPRAPS